MKSHQRRAVTAILLLGMALLAAVGALQGTLLSGIIAHYHLKDSAQGAASAAVSAGSVLALLGSFLLIGRLSKLALLRLAFCISAAALVLLWLAPVFGLFLALWLVAGIGSGFIDMLLSSCMDDLYEGQMATRMMCLLHTLYGLSSVICPVLYGGLIRGGMPWNGVYLCVACAEAALLIFMTAAMRRTGDSGEKTVAREKRLPVRSMAGLLRRGAMPGLLAAITCHGLFLGGLTTWVNRYVGVVLESPLGDLALSFLFFGVMASRLLMFFFPVSPVRYVRVGGIAGGLILLVALPLRSGAVMCAALSLQGLAFGALIPCPFHLSCRQVPESSMLATTSMSLCLYLAQIVASPLIGALESAVSLHAGIAFCGLFMMLTSACCLFAPLSEKGK